ncbi:hypothetical protein [Longivirga aurantiaca]|uniref:Uncharacterized protein n=1 Tax=Longivirga aurantiaca TaxID=1837743 RepID=A0ABW1T5W3_9ACTN
MTDDGRLEIDEHGRVVDAAGGPVAGTVLDLADPEAAEELRPNPVQRWVDTRAAPFVARHRAGVRVTSVVAVVALAATAWWTSRPPYVPPTFDLALANAVLEGNSIGGPEISPDGQLSVAFVARGRTPGETVSITGLRGPALRDVAATGAPVTSEVEERVGITARVDCTDPSLLTAGASSYALEAAGSQVGGDPEAGTVPLATEGTRPVTSLDKAITDWCLASLAPAAVTIGSVRATAVPGTPLADLSVEVANTSPQTLTLRTARHPGAGVEVDLSPAVVVRPGEFGLLATRVLVHDCTEQPALTPLGALPNASGPDGAGGLTLEVGLGGRARVASYPVAGAESLARTLATACTGATGVTAGIDDVGPPTFGAGGSWEMPALVSARSDGIGITFGREHFTGGESGVDSVLTSESSTVGGPGPATGDRWAFGPARIDGGAGRMLVPVRGGSCAGVQTASPQWMAVRVLMPDRSVHPYEVPVDDLALLQSVARACGLDLDVVAAEARGWRAS